MNLVLAFGETTKQVENDPTRFRKLEIYMFSGEQPIGWLLRLERYFFLYNVIEDEEKLEAVNVCLEGKALN